MAELDFFINDRMRTLVILHEHQVEIEGVKICPMNQVEIAKSLGCSKVKANQLLKELIDSGYIVTPKKGRYSLTDSAYIALNEMKIGEELC